MGNLPDWIYISISVLKEVFMLQLIDLLAEYNMPYKDWKVAKFLMKTEHKFRWTSLHNEMPFHFGLINKTKNKPSKF